MAFNGLNFSPVGANARRGAVPSVHSYDAGADDLAAVKLTGYYNELRDDLEPNDWIFTQTDTDATAVAVIQNVLVSPKSPSNDDVTTVTIDFSPAL